ncbi:polysaccharide synthase Cps1p [Pseudohyphozyma bogoriensis]|nr:polysaccharide synthase Cps1p [Pseudohyphozyma bogoriensis]
MKLEICNFSGYKIYPGKGRLYVKSDSKVFRFVSSKEESLFLQRKNPRKLAWTVVYRRVNKKGVSEEVAKKRSRKNVKHQRGIVGADLSSILAKRNQKPEVRNAQRAAALAAGKDKKKEAAAKKATKAPSGPKSAAPKVQRGAKQGKVGGTTGSLYGLALLLLHLPNRHVSTDLACCHDHVHSPVVPLGLIGIYRYVWYILRLLAAWSYRPIPVPPRPTYIPREDVTIIVPTIDADEGFAKAAKSWLENDPYEVLIITEESVVEKLRELVEVVNREDVGEGGEGRGRVQVLSVMKANKRLQMAEGIRAAKTDIIVFADDDAIWPPTLLPLVLACFEDQQMGGVGTSQIVKPVGDKFTLWETLAAFRLSIRNIEIAASTHIDGGVPCLSGRTAAYRSVILKDPEFLYAFTNDFWLGKYHLNSGDDKALTRWMVSHGWKTYVQCCEGAQLLTVMKPDWRFIKQVLRWTRNTWRSDLRSVFMERHVWYRHPYTTSNVNIGELNLASGSAMDYGSTIGCMSACNAHVNILDVPTNPANVVNCCSGTYDTRAPCNAVFDKFDFYE